MAILTAAQTTDVVNQPTWGDTIVTGAGDNIVLAGVGSDFVNDPAAAIPPTLVPSGFVPVPSAGDDIVIGDNGQVAWDVNGLIESFASTQPTFGGDDVVLVGDGANIVVGGFGNDTITTGDVTSSLATTARSSWDTNGLLTDFASASRRAPALGGGVT